MGDLQPKSYLLGTTCQTSGDQINGWDERYGGRHLLTEPAF